MLKRCCDCKQEKPLTEYHRQKKSRDGLQHCCKSCLKKRQRERYYRNRARDIEKSKRWNKLNAPRVAANMKKCRERRPEHFREYMRTWRANNRALQQLYDSRKHAKRRAAIHATIGRMSLAEWTAVIEQQQHRCWYCNRKVRKLTKDHIVPLAKGGTHHIDNIVAACSSCNSSKNAKSIDEFAKARGRLFF